MEAFRQRLPRLAGLFAIWAAVGAIIGWGSTDWVAYGVAGVAATIVARVVGPGRPVLRPTIGLVLLVFVVVAAIEDDGRGGGEAPERTTPTVTAPPVEVPRVTEFQRRAAERTVRSWFDAHRAGDATGLCLVETPRFAKRHGGCGRAAPRRSTPKGADLVFDSIEPVGDSGDGLTARVHAGNVRATVRLAGAGLYRVAGVTGLPR